MMNELNNAWEMGYGWIAAIILISILLLIVVVVTQKKNNRKIKEPSPMDIIKARYARGEISKEEFEEKHRLIL